MSYLNSTVKIGQGQSNFQQTSSRIVSSSQSGVRGQGGEWQVESRLDYQVPQGETILISGVSDISSLRNLKNVLLSLQTEFLQDGNKFILTGDQKDEFNKRLMLLENEIEGLMKRKINASSGEINGRSLDLSTILNEKENQIVELEKKIQNLEEKLRRSAKRENELEDEIVRLSNAIKLTQNPNISKLDLEKLTIGAVQYGQIEAKYAQLRNQMQSFAGLFRGHLEKLRSTGVKFEHEGVLNQLISGENIQASICNGVVNIVETRDKVIEVPTQDARTKHLVHLLATQMKRNFDKYPKLRDECDARLYELFQQELIDVMEADEFDRVVSVVKYIPEVVRVENVYNVNVEAHLKIQFHLRVLIRCLLEELMKLKAKTGAVLDLDEGVIAMIKHEILDLVDVDDILKVFRVVPKIVEVEKIVEKIVEVIVEVPQIVVVERVVEKIVQIEKIRQIQKNVPVPIEVPNIVYITQDRIVEVERIIEKVVEVPVMIDRIIEVCRQVPKVEIVQKMVERIVEVDRPVKVSQTLNHISVEIREVERWRDRIVPVEKIIQKIVQVPVIVEKIVEKVIRVPEIVEVEKIVQKIIIQKQYINVPETVNHVEVRNQIVERIVEKPVIIIQREQRIVEVPQVVEKVVQTTNTIDRPFEVQVIVEKIVERDRIKEVQKIVERIVEVIKEVPKIVERIVEVPVIHERIVKVTEIVEKPCIQTIQKQVPVIVELRNPIVVRQPKVVQIQRIVNHYIEVPKPIKYIEQKIVEVIRHVDRIKEIKVPVEKIIEKMVEVPRVVEVQKIVEKIVIVPRVCQKIVEVPQIVDRIVPKIIERQIIKEVEKIVEKPVFQDRIVEVPVQKIVYIEVEKLVEKVVDKLVELKTTEQRIVNHETIQERIIEVIKEVPRDIPVDKIVYCQVEVPKIIEVDKQVIVPVEIPCPVERIVEKLVPMTETIEKIVQVPCVMQKIIVQNTCVPQPYEVCRIEQKIVVDTKIKEVIKEVPYIRDQIKEVQVCIEKIVPVQTTCQEIITAKQIIEKVVEKSIIVPKIYEVQRFEQKIVEVPRIVQVEKIVPQLINVNKYINSIVEKIVEIPVIMERVKEVVRENEKVVEVKSQYERIKEVERVVERAVVLEKFKEVVRDINHIEKVLQIVDRIVNIPVEIISHEQRLVEVPCILEKIVQKIVVMPQIVEVLKHVHDVVIENQLGVALDVDVSIHENKYKQLSRDIKVQIDVLLVEIRKLKVSNPALRIQIEMIEKFFQEFEAYVNYPRIVQVTKEKPVEKIVEKEKVVQLHNDRSVKMQLSLSLLAEKLILELKRIKKENPAINFGLEDDVKLIFLNEFDSGSKIIDSDFNLKLKSYSDGIQRKFESLGNWTHDHQLMLNSFLQERFLMANLVKTANLEIEKARQSSSKTHESLRKLEADIDAYRGYFGKIKNSMSGVNVGLEMESLLGNILREVDQYNQYRVHENISYLEDLQINDARIHSLIRQKDAELARLRDEVVSLKKLKTTVNNAEAHQRAIQVMQDENSKLKNEINSLRVERGSADLITSYKQQIQTLNTRIHELQQEKSNLNAELMNLKHEYEVRLSVQNFNNTTDIKRSGITNDYTERNSEIKNSNLTSPVQKYNINNNLSSPKEQSFGIKMVDSKIEPGNNSVSSANRGPTYATGLTDSRQSGASSSSREQTSYGTYQGYQAPSSGYSYGGSVSGNSGNYSTTSYQPGTTSTTGNVTTGVTGGNTVVTTNVSGTGIGSGIGVTTSNIYTGGSTNPVTSAYQAYTSSTSGINQQLSPSYQQGSLSGSGVAYQSSTGSGSGIYQSGTFQSGAYQPTGQSGYYQSGNSGAYQSGTSGPYQPGTYQASSYTSTYKPGNNRDTTTGSNISSSNISGSNISGTGYSYTKK